MGTQIALISFHEDRQWRKCGFCSAVSLHSHMNHSKEEMEFVPGYRESIFKRLLEAMGDFFCYYPEYLPGKRRWTDRVLLRLEKGMIRPLSHYWKYKVPIWAKTAMWMIRLVTNENFNRIFGGLYPKENQTQTLGSCLKGNSRGDRGISCQKGSL